LPADKNENGMCVLYHVRIGQYASRRIYNHARSLLPSTVRIAQDQHDTVLNSGDDVRPAGRWLWWYVSVRATGQNSAE